MIPKSLHTVTVLVNVAKLIKASNYASTHYQNNTVAVQCALFSLGYADAVDTYELAKRAVAILESGK